MFCCGARKCAGWSGRVASRKDSGKSAYDVTFSVDLVNPFIGVRHAMSLHGSNVYEGKEQLIRFGKENDIRNASEIVEQVSDVVSRWTDYAKESGVENNTAGLVERFLI